MLVGWITVMQNSPFSALAVAASTHFTYPWRDDQAELARVAWLNAETVYPWTYLNTITQLNVE